MTKISFLILLLAIVSCQSQKKTTDQGNEKQTVICEPMLSFTEELNPGPSDYFIMDSISINGNCLEVYVNYSGGCGGSEFQLYNTNRIKESMPPQTVLFLHFKDNDPCRAIVRDTLYYDLSPFEKFANNSGIWLNFKGYEKSILYKTIMERE